MSANKLYNALIKSQQAEMDRKAEQSRPEVAEKEAPPGADEPMRATERLTDRYTEAYFEASLKDNVEASPRVDSKSLLPHVEFPYRPDPVPERQKPMLYDSAVSLEMINNPNPWTTEQLKSRKIIFPSMANKDILNAYRQLRIKLRNKTGENNFTVMVTSLSRKRSKRDNPVLPAFNLAASFALDAHSSALLVDCDPYRNDLRRLVSVDLGAGVTDYIDDRDLTVRDIIYPSGVDRLSVIPAGNIDVSAVELFSAQRMKSLMEELKDRYPDRYIVMNAPPFRLSTEARILERYVEHALMMVPFGELTADEILESVDALATDKFAGLMYQD